MSYEKQLAQMLKYRKASLGHRNPTLAFSAGSGGVQAHGSALDAGKAYAGKAGVTGFTSTGGSGVSASGQTVAGSGGAAGGSGVGASGEARRLMDEWETARNAANQANEARYQQALGIHDQRISGLEGYGQQQRADIMERGTMRQSQGLQSMMDRGLSGTTALNTMSMGYHRETEGELGRLGDRITDMRSGLLKDKSDLIERRQDLGPNEGLYASMLDKLGQGYGEGSGGGVSGRSNFQIGPPSGGYKTQKWSDPVKFGGAFGNDTSGLYRKLLGSAQASRAKTAATWDKKYSVSEWR